MERLGLLTQETKPVAIYTFVENSEHRTLSGVSIK